MPTGQSKHDAKIYFLKKKVNSKNKKQMNLSCLNFW